MTRWLLIILILPLMVAPAFAVNPDEVLDDPLLELRAREISADLRCLVCQNQSIDDSDADLARDLRLLVRERLVAGDSDTEVRDYIVDRYGEFVLLNPVMAWHTLVLWGTMPVVLLIAFFVLIARVRRRAPDGEGVVALSAEEREALEALRSKKSD